MITLLEPRKLLSDEGPYFMVAHSNIAAGASDGQASSDTRWAFEGRKQDVDQLTSERGPIHNYALRVVGFCHAGGKHEAPDYG